MSLGCNELTDDQLLDLLQEILAELTTRHHDVRTFAQRAIVTGAEKLAFQREALEKAIEVAKQDYVASLNKEVKENVKQLVASGEIKLMTSEQEAAHISLTDSQVKLEILKEIQQLNQSSGNLFSVSIRGTLITVVTGSGKLETNHILTSGEIKGFSESVARAMGI